MDNTAIARIAAPDLAADALGLLQRYGDNDDVVFFLGRLVWQGEMTGCTPALMDIACDPGRGRYARVAAVRGVMSVGDGQEQDRLWETIVRHPGPLDRAVLAEMLDAAPATMRTVELLLRGLGAAAPFEQFMATGLGSALHAFIDRLPVMVDGAMNHPLGHLVEGLNDFLGREPFIQRGECHVSEPFVWLMAPALHAVDRLVAARSTQALSSAAIAVMRNMPALRYWRSDDASEYKSSLADNVPRWHELNDHLYWTSIAETRARLAARNQLLVDDWHAAFAGHFWSFGADDFDRCLGWVASKDGDDRQVALSRCLRLYIEADRPVAWVQRLRDAVAGDQILCAVLEAGLDPAPSPAMVQMEAQQREWQREQAVREQAEADRRADWVRALKADPERVRRPQGLPDGAFSNDQLGLFSIAMGDRSATDRADGARWRVLIPEFGEPVARAYRDAAVAHWRAYTPGLQSEGANMGSTPYELIFAMAGIEIEAQEDDGFAARLTPEEARHALRYLAWELNGFPSWFEPVYRAHPAVGFAAVKAELVWDLEHSVADVPFSRGLHDILYHAPWLHEDVAPLIRDWLRTHEIPNAEGLRYGLNILANGRTAAADLVNLARAKVRSAAAAEHRPRWLALWVDTDPDDGIPALEQILKTLPPEGACTFAQRFVVSLLGDRHGNGTRTGAYRNAHDLKWLYILMHRYIRSAEDIERANKGVYSPTLRDNAQDARDTLFQLLSSEPGPEAYAAIKALEEEHPDPGYRRWMALRARERATADADEPLWPIDQVLAFAQNISGA